jgi:hypothetical protein
MVGRLSLRAGAVVTALMLASGACARARVPVPDRPPSVRVRIALEGDVGGNLRTFVARNIQIASRPTLPSDSMSLVLTGSGMVAMASGRIDRSMLFVLQEDSFLGRPTLTVFHVSPQQPRAIIRRDAESEDAGLTRASLPSPACETWSAFFVQGVGDRPSGEVSLQRWHDDGRPSRLMRVDPARHTIDMMPVLRFSPRDVKKLRHRKATFLLGVTAIPGATPFVLLGLLRRADGSYSEEVFESKHEEQGWAAFAHVPGENMEFSFYALDDSPRFRSVCRTRLAQ